MAYQTIFERYEMKYLLTPAQKEAILRGMQPYMQLDQYGRSTIRNLYFDTDTFRLVRRSLEKPAYKEKLRVRSYQPAQGQTPVFVELKKKYRSIVYKRRLVLPWEPVFQSFQTGEPLPVHSQIAREIEYFRQYYAPLSPKVYLSYEREAHYALDGSDFRVTLDEAIRYRTQQLTLEGENQGQLLLPPGHTLMELKTSGGIPLWMCRLMTQQGVYRTSFSKYGTAYRNMQQTNQGGPIYA